MTFITELATILEVASVTNVSTLLQTQGSTGHVKTNAQFYRADGIHLGESSDLQDVIIDLVCTEPHVNEELTLRFPQQSVAVDVSGSYIAYDDDKMSYRFTSVIQRPVGEKDVDKSPNALWRQNERQFPRLLCEIMATQENLNLDNLAQAMDLKTSDVTELFDRANTEWESFKQTI